MAGFIVLIAGVDALIMFRWFHRPDAPVLAARDLPAGHLVQPGDLALGPPVARYLRTPVKANQPITDVMAQPTTAWPAAGDILVSTPVDRELVSAGKVNAGVAIMVCRDGKALTAKPLTVRTVLCPGAGACTALVEAAADAAASLAAPTSPGALSVRAAATSNPCGV
jgi:hypothetical protein